MKGIPIGGKENKLEQYAENSFSLLDGNGINGYHS